VSEIKGDSQAYELAEQRTLLPGERELLGQKWGDLAGAAALLKVFRCQALSGVASGSIQARRCQLGLTLPLVTRMFLQGP
jgi:hypothetical protein